MAQTLTKFTRWQRTESQYLAADPEAVYSIVGNLSQTGSWMKSFDGFVVHDDQRGVGTKVDLLAPGKLFGPLRQKSHTGRLHHPGNPAQRMVKFTQPQPGGEMVLRWRVDAADTGAILRFTVELRGPGTTAFKFSVANTLCEDFALACARLFKTHSFGSTPHRSGACGDLRRTRLPRTQPGSRAGLPRVIGGRAHPAYQSRLPRRPVPVGMAFARRLEQCIEPRQISRYT